MPPGSPVNWLTMVVPPVTPAPESTAPRRMVPVAATVTVKVVVLIEPVKTAAGTITVLDGPATSWAALKSIDHAM